MTTSTFLTAPPGLDPHQDTPVEILHVILLGFVKYFWRDVIQNQLKKKPDKIKLLATRLTSFDVSGLGISPLAGHTLVQYSGSLTGRDFRAIAQAAPFVLYDLVSSDCLSTWVALSKLIPLVWQPEIRDIDAHVVRCLPSMWIKIVQRCTHLTRHTRNSSRRKYSTFCSAQHAGLAAGSTSQNFTFLYTFPIIFAVSDQPFSSQPRPSNRSTR